MSTTTTTTTTTHDDNRTLYFDLMGCPVVDSDLDFGPPRLR